MALIEQNDAIEVLHEVKYTSVKKTYKKVWLILNPKTYDLIYKRPINVMMMLVIKCLQ